MASIQSLGIGSGLLTSDLVEDIISAEREATDLRINAEKAEFEARISSYGSIKSTLEVLRRAADDLSRSSSLLSKTATSSNETAVTATADSSAAPNVHSVEVFSLARNHTLASARFDSLDSVVGDGTLDFRFGTTTFSGGNYDTFTENADVAAASVTIDPSSNTLEGVRDAVNEAGIGVTANIVNDGEGYVLVFTSEASGEANSMEITVTEGATPGLSALSFNVAASTPGTNFTQTVAADDARMSIDGILVRRDSNSFSDVVRGVTFTAASLNAGAPATVSINQDTADVTERVQAFVDAFNDVKRLTDQLTDFDEDLETGALLMGDPILRNVRTRMQRLLGNAVDGVESTALRSLVDIGITTDQNADYLLRLDAGQLQTALAGSPGAVAALLADESRASDDLVRFSSFAPETEAGSYDVVIGRTATRGSLVGAAVPGLAGPILIDADNDELSLTVDGVATGPISLSAGSYADGEALAQMIETRVNAAGPLEASGIEITITYNATEQRLELESGTYGSRSLVGITGVDANTLATLGLDVDSGESSRGVDVAGTINGISGSGAGQFLSIPRGPLPATAGVFTGEAVTSFDTPPLVIDSSNSAFTLAVDGVTSGSILLTEGDYADGASLAAEMQERINTDPALSAAARSVTVAYDPAAMRFEITSDTTSNGSTVNVLSISAGAQAAYGLTVGSGEPGVPAGRAPDPAGGIQIQVLGGAAGPRGQLTLVRGVMNQFDRFLDTVLNLGGTLDTKVGTLEERLDDLDAEAVDFDTRMDLLEERLRFQFAAADALISQLNSTSSFLDQQLSSLPGYTSNEG